ncbi:hypothetical protein [Azospirillum largimobile]
MPWAAVRIERDTPGRVEEDGFQSVAMATGNAPKAAQGRAKNVPKR